jgi:hypothetical protein
MHEKTSAAAAPRNPKKGAVSSPLNTDVAMALGKAGFLRLLLLLERRRRSIEEGELVFRVR